jgi:hypothetical protein
MGKPKKNKKAEIKARRKARKVTTQIRDLKTREKRVKEFLQNLMEVHEDAFESLAESEIEEATVESPSSEIPSEIPSSEAPQSNQ